MLVICVACAVLGSILYTIIRIRIHEWISDSRMDRQSLRKTYSVKPSSSKAHAESLQWNDIVEITDDESDSESDLVEPKIQKGIFDSKNGLSTSSKRSGNDVMPVEASNNTDLKKTPVDVHGRSNSDSETEWKGDMKIFEKSTDSLELDEDIDKFPVHENKLKKPRTSLFDWNFSSSSKLKPKSMSVYSNASHISTESRRAPRRFGKNEESQLKKQKVYEELEEPVPTADKVENKPAPEVIIQHEITVAGTKVKLPVKPYPCQTAVMNMLIQGCAKEQNCLLESPTGSGKTLALLCGVLAWQEQYKAEIDKETSAMVERAMRFGHTSCENKEAPGSCQKKELDNQRHYAKASSDNCCDQNKLNNSFGFYGLEDEYSDEEKGPFRIVPKVYYGTRTHKQIEQVIRELKKTSYRYKRMTILSSREHTCIQESERSKTELCNELLDPAKPGKCEYYSESSKRPNDAFMLWDKHGLQSPWDIEDLVRVGKTVKTCPYFGAKSLMLDADIIFCPYNYIIDPDIRESMQINIKDQIIILDEAHNIEDICRDAASVNFREDHIHITANEFETLAKRRAADAEVYDTLKNYFLGLQRFIKGIGVESIDTSDNLSSPRWTGAELMELLDMHDIGRATQYSFFMAGKEAIMHYQAAKEDTRVDPEFVQPIISNATKRFLEQLAFALEMIGSTNFANDYRACVIESMVKDVQFVADNTWQSSRKNEQRVRTLKLICMNPGVIFTPLATAARSIILASGTLAPTSSFQSELGTKFPHMLSANHVIPKDQVYVRCIPRGPTGVALKANYQNVNSWSFQDELGKLIVDVCQSVPYGVLCFFSSYHVMHTQIERWRKNGAWSKLGSLKEIFLEPRYGGDLANIMRDYREAIRAAAELPRTGTSGALLFAVFRGKVAEGIDFSDNEARCVMSIGIPYAVRKDPVVEMKYNYNDINSSKGLLKGGEWYTVQAFRALNQALGRCVRHKNDWGAVLLVDERFQMQSNISYLPKWIKSMWIDSNMYNLKEDLHRFVIRQVERENQNSGP